jgi:putative serine protease PepD
MFGLRGGGSTVTTTAPQTTVQSTTVVRSSSQIDAETVYKRDSPGVVDIQVTTSSGSQGLSPFGPSGSQQTQAEGTGFVYDKSGHIVTADHVVSGATKITVRFENGTTAKATLVGTDPSTDTAVIKVSAPPSELTPLELGDSSAVQPGEGVVAIGSPFGYEGSITAGIVSAIGRNIDAPNGYAIPNAIQTDAPINHGNSGGPLIGEAGKVIGINVQIADDGQGSSINAGVGFAVPSNTVRSVADDLIAGRKVAHPYLGVSVGDAQSGTGARIGTVRAGSPAAKAKLEVGDVIVAVDGQPIADADQLTAVISAHQPGDTVTLTVQHAGSTETVKVTLGTRPTTAT